jgi:hypothetical protein
MFTLEDTVKTSSVIGWIVIAPPQEAEEKSANGRITPTTALQFRCIDNINSSVEWRRARQCRVSNFAGTRRTGVMPRICDVYAPRRFRIGKHDLLMTSADVRRLISRRAY